jgi:hypothetical protein
MKKHILLLATLFIGLFSYSQDWHPVTPNGIYHYTNQNTTYAITTIFADSFKTDSNKTTYYLNRVPIECDTCVWLKSYISNNKYYQNHFGIFIHNGGQFLKKKIVVSKSGEIHFKDSFEYLLKLYAPIGEPWIFDSSSLRMAKIVSKSKTKILGENDSIITYYLTDGDQIILSKKHGIVSFPDFKNNQEYELIGIEGNNNGYNSPTIQEISDFDVGDMFKYYEDRGGVDPPIATRTTIQYEIINKTFRNDSIIFSIEGTKHMKFFVSGFNNYKDFIYYKENSLPHFENFRFSKFYNNQIIQDTSGLEIVYVQLKEDNEGDLFIVLTGIFNPSRFSGNSYWTIKKSLLFNEFPDTYKNFIVGKNQSYESYSSFKPHKGVFVYSYEHEGYGLGKKLIGCRINNIVYGEINSIHESQKPLDLKIYPNPIQDILKIDLSQNQEPISFQILNLNGKCLKEFSNQNTFGNIELDCSFLPAGVYLLKIRNANDVKTYKIQKI